MIHRILALRERYIFKFCNRPNIIRMNGNYVNKLRYCMATDETYFSLHLYLHDTILGMRIVRDNNINGIMVCHE